MRTREYEDKKYWNNLRGSREHLGYEDLVLDGSDGEQEFDDELLKTVEGNDVLDLGCGIGPFALEVAKSARKPLT